MSDHTLIAIIGTSMEFPGDIRSLSDLHDRLLSRTDAIRSVPHERWDADDYFDKGSDRTTTINNKRGGFIDNIKAFGFIWVYASMTTGTYAMTWGKPV